jgi:hypothetical protein
MLSHHAAHEPNSTFGCGIAADTDSGTPDGTSPSTGKLDIDKLMEDRISSGLPSRCVSMSPRCIGKDIVDYVGSGV